MMVALITCFACRRGDCKHCEGGRWAPKGMFGGTRCPCKGDCEPQPDREMERITAALRAAKPSQEDGEAETPEDRRGLVRPVEHGTSERDVELDTVTQAGQEQARELGAKLAQHPEWIALGAVSAYLSALADPALATTIEVERVRATDVCEGDHIWNGEQDGWMLIRHIVWTESEGGYYSFGWEDETGKTWTGSWVATRTVLRLVEGNQA